MSIKKSLRTKKEIREAYKGLKYDRVRFGSPGGKYTDEVEKKIVSNFLKKGSVLELGVGTGRYGIFLAKMGYNFFGIDISENMLKIAKKKARSAGLDINLIQMDAENLAFHEKFDNVICIHTFHFFPHPLEALRGMYEVLHPGGRCVVSFESYNRLDTKFRIYFRAPRQWFFSLDDVEILFKKVGFKTIYRRSLFKFPLGLYRRAPKLLLKIMKKLDNPRVHTSGGCISIIVGEK